MSKGAILIGVGFTPTDEDVKVARLAGYLKNANSISRVHLAGAVEQLTSAFVLEKYANQLEENEWDLPGDLQLFRLVNQESREMWSVCPTSLAPTQDVLPNKETVDILIREALKKPIKLKRETLKIYFGLILGLIFCVVCISFAYKNNFGREAMSLKDIRSNVKRLDEICKQKRLDFQEPVIKGETLFWDFEEEDVSVKSNSKLPYNSLEEILPITVFVLYPKNNEHIYTYKVKGSESAGLFPLKGYRVSMDVCVIYWPSNEVIGYHSFSADPPEEISCVLPSGSCDDAYGDVDSKVDEWIDSLKKMP